MVVPGFGVDTVAWPETTAGDCAAASCAATAAASDAATSDTRPKMRLPHKMRRMLPFPTSPREGLASPAPAPSSALADIGQFLDFINDLKPAA